MFCEDNKEAFNDVEAGLHGMMCMPLIKTFQRSKDGRGAFNAILAQWTGVDKWEAMWKKSNELIVIQKWKGQSSYTLERFIALHRNAFATMEQ